MELQIRPQPDPAERAAIEIALERLLSGPDVPGAYTSGWREAGIAENIEFPKTSVRRVWRDSV